MKRLVLPGLVAAAALLILATIALAGTVLPDGPAQPGTPGDQTGRVTVPAPIDGVDVLIRESYPPQVSAKISAGLPSGCAEKHSHSVERQGDTITITVLNSMPAGDPVCTMIYGMYELMVDLGGDFEAGRTYTLKVNDHVTTFRT